MKSITSICFAIFMGLTLAISGIVLLTQTDNLSSEFFNDHISGDASYTVTFNPNGGTLPSGSYATTSWSSFSGVSGGWQQVGENSWEINNQGYFIEGEQFETIEVVFNASKSFSVTVYMYCDMYGEDAEVAAYELNSASNIVAIAKGNSSNSYTYSIPQGISRLYFDLWVKNVQYVQGSYYFTIPTFQENTKTVTYGSTYGTMPTPTRSGYDFLGWYTSSSGGTKKTSSSTYNISGNSTLYAQWSVKSYTVTFNPNGGILPSSLYASINFNNLIGNTSDGTDIQESGIYSYSSNAYGNSDYFAIARIEFYVVKSFTLNFTLESFSRSGDSGMCGFGVSELDSDDSFMNNPYYVASEESIDASYYLSVGTHWIYIAHLVSQYSGYSYGCFTIENIPSFTESSRVIVYGANYGILPTPSRSGYNFNGWWTSSSGGNQISATTTYNFAYNTSIYAHWTAKTYTLNFNANGGSVSPTSKSVTYNSRYGTLPTPTRANYTFGGWWTSSSGGNQISSSLTYSNSYSTTVYAHWTPITISNTVHLRVINKDGSYTDVDNASGGTVTVGYYNSSGTKTTKSQTEQSYTYTVHKGQKFELVANNNSGYAFVGFSTSSTPSEAIKNPSGPPSTTLTNYPTTNTNYYVYFKKVSDNRLKYDETDKYFYFEDGNYPQSYACWYNPSLHIDTGERIEICDPSGNYSSLKVYKDSAGQRYALVVSTRTCRLKLNGENKYLNFTEGEQALFKFEPIRWRISDYGVAKTERNIARYTTLLKFKNYASFSDNFTAVSDLILGVGSMHGTRTVSEGDSVRDMSGFAGIENMTDNLTNDSLRLTYNRTGNIINVDEYSGYGNGQTNAVNKNNTISYSSPFRITSLAELNEVGFVNRGARASDMVAFILGQDTNQVSYWTRDLSNLGSGIAITPTGTQIQPWLDEMLGMRFSYTFKEGSSLI